MALTLAALRHAREILKRYEERPVIMLSPRLWRYAKRRGYLKNRAYYYVRAKKVVR